MGAGAQRCAPAPNPFTQSAPSGPFPGSGIALVVRGGPFILPAMAQICVPLPPLDGPRAVDVELTVDGVRQSFHYRVETLMWADYGTLPKVEALQRFLDGHDDGWQLVAIGVPAEESVPVLFRVRPRPHVAAQAAVPA